MNGKTHTCPTHGTPLQGGPVRYWCDRRHGVVAADLPHEFQPNTAHQPPPRSATIDHTAGKCICGEDTCPGWRAAVAERKLKADVGDLFTAVGTWKAAS